MRFTNKIYIIKGFAIRCPLYRIETNDRGLRDVAIIFTSTFYLLPFIYSQRWNISGNTVHLYSRDNSGGRWWKKRGGWEARDCTMTEKNEPSEKWGKRNWLHLSQPIQFSHQEELQKLFRKMSRRYNVFLSFDNENGIRLDIIYSYLCLQSVPKVIFTVKYTAIEWKKYRSYNLS